MRRSIVLVLALLTDAAAWAGVQTEAKVFSDAKGEKLVYRFAAPTKVEAGKTYPLVVFLHGYDGYSATDECDNESQLKTGAKHLLEGLQKPGHEAFFVAPQLPKGKSWVVWMWDRDPAPHALTPMVPPTMALLEGLLENIFKECPVDRKRVVLHGCGIGGYGAWDIAQRHPDWFSELTVVCGGGGDPMRAWKIRELPVTVHQGDADTWIPPSRARGMVSALWAMGGNVRYFEHVGRWDAPEKIDSVYANLEAMSAPPREIPHELVPAKDLTVACVYTNAAGKTLPYRLATPTTMNDAHPAVDPKRKYPLVIFFHGHGAGGTDNLKQIESGGSVHFLNYWRKTGTDGFLLAPQCTEKGFWVDQHWSKPGHALPEKPSESMALAIEIIERTMREQPIDPDRVYVSGLSMGGFATWDIVMRHSDWFAAALPICGGGDSTMAWKIRELPIWTFHGNADNIVAPRRSRDMVDALWRVRGNIRYREYNGVKHNAWDATYSNWDEVLAWFFSQRRKR